MYTQYTYQDWEKTPEHERLDLIPQIIATYANSQEFKNMLTAQKYFCGENEEIAQKYMMRPKAFENKTENGKKTLGTTTQKVVGNRIANNFFFRFIVQENMRLLSYGVTLPEEYKNRLGKGFDNELAKMGEKALVQGVCWGFFNADHLEMIPAAKDKASGLVALLDEMTGMPRLAVQFWRLGKNRPQYVRLFEHDGVTVYQTNKDNRLEVYQKKRNYLQTVRNDGIGETVVNGQNWPFLPVIPMYGNPEHASELTQSLRAKIDLFDRILSDFGDNLDRANDVYWVLNNFGGGVSEIVKMMEQINTLKAVLNQTNGETGGSTAEPRTIEVPYAARKTALEILKKVMYEEYMAVDMDEITGGSLTNVAIEAATDNSELKTDRYEWEVNTFIRSILMLHGIDTDEIKFKRRKISNDKETIESIYLSRNDFDRRTALEKNPLVQDDEIDAIMENIAAEEHTGLASMDILQREIDALTKGGTDNDGQTRYFE